MRGIPSQCPCCGAYSLAPEQDVTTLVAVCDVLVVKALERIGMFLIRGERSRYRTFRETELPAYLAHTLWPADDELTERALRGAWDVVPALVDHHGCCGVEGAAVARVLDDYVHDLVLTGTVHTVEGEGGLAYRFTARLGIPIPEVARG